jgi:hypothetical protein
MTLGKLLYHLVKDKLLTTRFMVPLHNYITQQMLDSNSIVICLGITVMRLHVFDVRLIRYYH